MNAREAILSRLRSADVGSLSLEANALLIAPERPVVDETALVQAFLAKITLPSLAGTHDAIDTLSDLPLAINRYLEGHALSRTICLPPDPRLMDCDWSGFSVHKDAAPDEAAALAIARCGVAETGSLVLETSPAAPMLPNFLALHHIVLLEADAIVAHLEDAVLAGPQPRAHYWITGVSGTTDIEGTYVRGAHGPRFLHVIMLRNGWSGVPSHGPDMGCS